MNDPYSRFLFLLLLYLQYLLQHNNENIAVVLFTFWHMVRQECQVAAMKRKLKVRIKWHEFQKLLSEVVTEVERLPKPKQMCHHIRQPSMSF